MQDPPFGSNGENISRLFLLAAAGSLLGSLEWIDLCIINLDLNLDMAGKITDAVAPFLCRCRIGAAYLADGPGDNAIAPFTIFYHHLAGTASKDTTLLTPKGTLDTWKYCLTLHASSS
jgi:hypothetical protein